VNTIPVELASERTIRERNKLYYRFNHWPIWIFVFFIAPGPLTFDLFAHGFDRRMALWLGVVLTGTAAAGLRGRLPGVELTQPELARYSRHVIMPEVGLDGQKRLKAAKRDPVLERFIIDGENISVRIDGQGVLPITEYRRPPGPPAGPGVSVQFVRRESVPGAASSIYNRSLYQRESAPAGGTPTPPAQPQRTVAQPAQPAQQAQQPAPGQKKPEEQPRSDRFSLIELE